MKKETFEIIAKTFQGLEDVLAREITELGGENIEIGRRMVSFQGDKALLYKANVHCRTALRILKPIHTFSAASTDEVYEKVKQFDWSNYLSSDSTFAIDSVVFSDEFKHSKFVTYRAKDAIADFFFEKEEKRPSVRVNNADIIINLHIAHHTCTLSLDSSGESLHKRGYRVEQTEAPINEVLAAGLILKSGWKGEKNFIDPMCGSGTLLIEAALIATNTSPGIYRRDFAFEKWPDFDEELFDQIYNDDSGEKDFEFKIYGSDISPKAISIAQENIKSAGMSKYISLQVKPMQQYTEAPENAILITNPPYGERISSRDLMELYEMIGERLKHVFRGYDAWIISYREECFEKIGLKPSAKIDVMNGPLECEYRKYEIFDGKYNDFKREGGAFKKKSPEEESERPFRKRSDRTPPDRERRKPAFAEKRNSDFDRRNDRYERNDRSDRSDRNDRKQMDNYRDERENKKPEIIHGEEAMQKFITFKKPTIGVKKEEGEDNRPGWKKLRDKNLGENKDRKYSPSFDKGRDDKRKPVVGKYAPRRKGGKQQ